MKKIIILGVACAMLAGSAFGQSRAGWQPSDANRTGPRAVDPTYTTGRYRAEQEGLQFLEPGNPLQQKRAGALAAEAGVSCDLVSAGQVNAHRGGGETYEIACKNDFGWIVSKAGGKVSAYDCYALAASEKAAKGKLATCRLRENVGSTAGLGALAQRAGLACKPAEGVYLGGDGAPPSSRYEVLCEGAAGYIIDAPQPKSSAAMLAMSCARAKAAGMGACALKPKG